MKPPVTAREIAHARERFLSAGEAESAVLSPVIAHSWARSRDAGVRVDGGEVPYSGLVDGDSRLVKAARYPITLLSEGTSLARLSIVLSNRHAHVLERIDNDHQLASRLDRISLAPGFDYAEGQVGTNGVGTVVATGKAAFVDSTEHFHDRFRGFACAGAPIRDPLTGQLEGVLDLSCLTADSHSLLPVVVAKVALDIEQNLLRDHSPRQLALFDVFTRVDNRSDTAVFGFGNSLTMANSLAQSRFDQGDQRQLALQAHQVLDGNRNAPTRLELASGAVVALRYVAVSVGDDVVGAVLEVTDIVSIPHRQHLREGGTAAPLSVEGGSRTKPTAGGVVGIKTYSAASRSPLWKAACSDLYSAVRRGDTVLVLGEGGTGKFSVINEIHHAIRPSRPSILVEPGDLEAIIPPRAEDYSQFSDHAGIVIFRNIHQLDDSASHRLHSFLATLVGSTTGLRVAATADVAALGNGDRVAALLPYFSHTVTVPPLRLRRDDVAGIVQQLLDQLSPQTRRAASPEALKVLAAGSWPGNIPQLRNALKYALTRHPAGTIRPEDLPDYPHQGVLRRLSPLEIAERDTIVAALHHADGNRLQAAAALELSRSSLYRKLKVYGLENAQTGQF